MKNTGLGRLFELRRLATAFLAAFLLVSISAGAEEALSRQMIQAGIKNLKIPESGVFSSGQPTEEQLKVAADAGIKHVVNLRPKSEQSFDEQAVVTALGMQYHSLSVPGAAGITNANASEFNQILKTLSGEPVLVHCASGNRVGALKALAEFNVEGQVADAAVQTGKQWGLSSLEPLVRGKLLP